MTDRHTIELDYPVDHDGQKVTALFLRRPKGRDLKRLQESKGTDIDKSFRLIADLAEVDPKLIEEMDPADIDKVNDWLEPILDPKARRAASS